jgi:hypothetical protein
MTLTTDSAWVVIYSIIVGLLRVWWAHVRA